MGLFMLKRAYSLLHVKSIDEDQRILIGVASTPSTDSYGDIVEPEGAEYKLPLPLLWQHKIPVRRSAKSSTPEPPRRASKSKPGS
jgi:hypothetical protein